MAPVKLGVGDTFVDVGVVEVVDVGVVDVGDSDDEESALCDLSVTRILVSSSVMCWSHIEC